MMIFTELNSGFELQYLIKRNQNEIVHQIIRGK